MLNTLCVIVWLIALIVIIPMVVVIIEVLAAMLLANRKVQHQNLMKPPKTVVLIPAHNEESVITDTLVSLNTHLPENCSLLCVAHNCTDATAKIASDFGAEVIEINDNATGGKPDAIKAGLQWLDSIQPEVVVIIDADCLVSPNTVSLLANQVKQLGHPVMGAYFFAAAERGQQMSNLSSLAVMLKNFIRPLGLHKLGLPCLLNGSGSAYPFDVIRNSPHGEGSIAEDYQLSVDLLKKGYPTTFVPEAKLQGQLPVDAGTAKKQRQRWEHGHLYLSFNTAPRLLLKGLLSFNKKTIALSLELLVPPLAYLGLIWLLIATVSAFLSTTLLYILLFIATLFFMVIFLSFCSFEGIGPTVTALATLPDYVLWKIPIYRDFFIRRETRWQKTERD